jgi:hypothetical protein
MERFVLHGFDEALSPTKGKKDKKIRFFDVK